MIFEIFKFDIDEKNFDDENNNDFNVKNIFIVDKSFINAINFSNFSSTFNKINFILNLLTQLNIEFNTNNVNNFLFRIKKTYKKNKKF